MFLNDSAVNRTKVTPLCHTSDNIQVLKAVKHEQRMESNADGPSFPFVAAELPFKQRVQQVGCSKKLLSGWKKKKKTEEMQQLPINVFNRRNV